MVIKSVLSVCLVMSIGATAMGQDSAAPRLSGEVVVPALSAPVALERDAQSIPIIHGDTEADVMCALGWAHAQDRYFQMDMARRLAAGELAEVAGAAVVSMDRAQRVYRFRDVARRVLEQMDDHTRGLVESYAAGVNAGLDDLDGVPPEYGLLGATPQPWQPEDSVLVMLSMFTTLHFNASTEYSVGVMHEALSAPMVDFLTPAASRLDVPLLTDGSPGENDATTHPIPGPSVVDLRDGVLQTARAADVESGIVDLPIPGSNNWAVAGSRTTHGGAMIANDPHLQITAPILWYRAELHWGDRVAMGATLPGVPGVIIGSTDRLAWGFTNMMGDFQDLIVIETHPDDDSRYRTPDGWEPFETITDTIDVRGGQPQTITMRATRWGIVTRNDWHGRPMVLKWTALDPSMVNLAFLAMSRADSLEEGVEIVSRWYGPAQNVMLADATGRIAWAVSGYLPARSGFTGGTPVSWADGSCAWSGPLDASLRPVVIDPPSGLLYTANNRTVSVDRARPLGNFWAPADRARRIRDRLRAQPMMSEADMLAIQLDTRVETLDVYRALAEEALGAAHERIPDADRWTLLDAVGEWTGYADADQRAVMFLTIFRSRVQARVLNPFIAPCRVVDPQFRYRWFQSDEVVQRVLEERPSHLLASRYGSWTDLLRQAAADAIASLRGRDPDRAIDAAWGEWNMTDIQHPIAQVMPMFGPRLNMPATPQPGHSDAVRVSSPSFGASLRIVASPSNLDGGIFHMPTGQSGHFQSPHYRDGHTAWLNGEPTSLKAGPPRQRMVLVPGVGGR